MGTLLTEAGGKGGEEATEEYEGGEETGEGDGEGGVVGSDFRGGSVAGLEMLHLVFMGRESGEQDAVKFNRSFGALRIHSISKLWGCLLRFNATATSPFSSAIPVPIPAPILIHADTKRSHRTDASRRNSTHSDQPLHTNLIHPQRVSLSHRTPVEKESRKD